MCTDGREKMLGATKIENNHQSKNGGEDVKMKQNVKENNKSGKRNKKKQVVILGDSLIQNLQNVNLGYTLRKNNVVEDSGVRIEKMKYYKKHEHKDMYVVRKLPGNNTNIKPTETTRELIEDIIKVAYGGSKKHVGNEKGLSKGDSYLSDSGVSLNEEMSTSNGELEDVNDNEGGKNADSATVMGNASVINASCIKKTPDSDADVNINMGMSETIEAQIVQNDIVLKKTKDAKTKKGQVKSSSNKFTKEDAKELQKEVDNLQNQLKERTDRINELETTLKNNNNNKLEERSEFERRHTELENQLNLKNLNIIEIEGKFTSAQSLIQKSSRSFEALGIVLQYYLKQIALVTKQLTEALDEKTKLEGKNGDLSKETETVKSELQEIMKKLDAEKCRCESLQNDLESLAVSHEAEITALVEKHNTEQKKLEESLKEEKEKGIEQAKEEYNQQVEQLKADHETEITNLNNVHQNQIQEVLQEKGNSISDLVTSHGSALKTKESEHAKAMEDLEKLHATKYNELMERLNVTVSEKTKVEKRLEEIVKELESDNRIQTALLPYKHLPEELQSLQVVLELRNEEIKTHRLKNMELQKKVDEYYELKTRFDSISQENQSLKESLRKRALSERKLSVERDTLLEKFENELKKVDMLAMEKEQLMWRASNPDLSTSLPNVFEDVEDEGCSMSPLRSSGSFSTSPPITFAPSKLKKRSMNMNNTIPLSKSDYQLH